MANTFPDPVAEAKAAAAFFIENKGNDPGVLLDRTITDSPMLDKAAVLAGVTRFHKERLKAIPDPVRYPEAKPWVSYVLAYEKQFQASTGYTDEQLAVNRSLGEYLCFRGFRECASARSGAAGKDAGKPAKLGKGKGTGLKLSEKCRVVFDPDTDQGAVHAKNVDDPITHFKRTKNKITFGEPGARRRLIMDGTGSGLHLDTEPTGEIFPLPMLRMCSYYNDETPGALEFIKRYGRFWSGANIVMMDHERRSVAIEKCSRQFINVYHPDHTGRSHCSGMAVRNADSPMARHQRAMRAEYLALFGLHNNAKDTADVAFWDACDKAERMLAWFLSKPAQIAVAELEQFMIRPFPHGLCKVGAMLHPKQQVAEYTLVTVLHLWDKRVSIRYQRDEKTGKYPDKPEVYKG